MPDCDIKHAVGQKIKKPQELLPVADNMSSFFDQLRSGACQSTARAFKHDELKLIH
jgi:hypothetical protein